MPTEVTLTIVIGSYPTKPMELQVSNINSKFNKAVQDMTYSCRQFKPGACANWKYSKKTWYIARHHRHQVEQIAKDYYEYVSVTFRRD